MYKHKVLAEKDKRREVMRSGREGGRPSDGIDIPAAGDLMPRPEEKTVSLSEDDQIKDFPTKMG